MEQHHRHHNDLTSNNTLSIKELQLPCLKALRLGEGLKSARCVQYVREFQGRVTDGMRRATEFREFDEQARGFRLWQKAG